MPRKYAHTKLNSSSFDESKYVSTQFGIEQINGYKKLEYIESDGTQYIDTNYIFTNNKHKTIIKFNNIKPVGSDSVYWACGSYVNASTRSGGIGLQTSGYLGLGLGDIGMGSTNIRIDNPTTPIELTIQSNGNGTFSMTGGSVDYINQNVGGNVTTGKTELLFGPNANGTKSSQVKMKLYYVKLYDNDVLVRHFIPCESNDNRIGMYDLCNSGKNLFDKNAFNSDIVYFHKLRNDNGVETADNSSCYSDYTIKVKPNTNYGILPQDNSKNGGLERIYFLDENKNWISRTTNFGGNQTIITTPNNCSYMQFQVKNNTNDVVSLLNIQVEEGSSITSYEPYPFYTNNGTGEFIKGSYISSIHYYIPIRQLQKYIELEYLESSGTQYIDTNVMIDDMNYVIKSDLMYCSTGTQVIYGEMNSTMGYPGIIINGAGDFRYGTTDRHILSSPFVRDTKYSTELSFKKLKLDGVEIIATEATNTSPLTYSIYLFARNNIGVAGNHSSSRIYNWSVSHNGELIKDLIPVKRNIDGVLGMYDKVNDVFYTNRGSGNFIAGPEK